RDGDLRRSVGEPTFLNLLANKLCSRWHIAAAASGSIGGVRLLLIYGADIHRTGGKYFTVSQTASVSKNYEVLRLLPETGADVNTFGGYCLCPAFSRIVWPSYIL
ncbi:hypothetical protein N7519_010437, partial [Penicillium mononematosum]|uniref:uncharacterized protein n=1 Tax=Penicillium mononematosum TaxID=268346 RepID=UPI002548F673